jgi:hypothetical protein
MRKFSFFRWILGLTLVFFLAGCASTRCDCENNRKYKPKKARISLMDNQKNSTFALRNSGKKEV